MRPLLPSLLARAARLPLLPLLLLLLAGCCANDTCACNDLLEDAIRLRFRVDGVPAADPSGFRRAELDTIRLVRYRLPVRDRNGQLPAPTVPPTAPVAPDTVVLVRPVVQDTAAIVISNTAPFAVQGALKVDAYRYAVLLADRRRRQPLRVRQRFEVTSVIIKGRYDADGCCTCYENTDKSAYLRTWPAGASAAPNDSVAHDLREPPRQTLVLARRP